MDYQEKLELARFINETGLSLRRYFYTSIFQDGEDESIPALTPPQVEMIIAIHAHGRVTVKQLAQVLCVKAPSVSNRVDRLVEMGILTREENPADRREVMIRISPEHTQCIEEVERRKFQAAMELIDKIGPEHARMWRSVFQRIDEVLENAGYG